MVKAYPEVREGRSFLVIKEEIASCTRRGRRGFSSMVSKNSACLQLTLCRRYSKTICRKHA